MGFLWCYCLCNSLSLSAINECKGNSGRKILNNIFWKYLCSNCISWLITVIRLRVCIAMTRLLWDCSVTQHCILEDLNLWPDHLLVVDVRVNRQDSERRSTVHAPLCFLFLLQECSDFSYEWTPNQVNVFGSGEPSSDHTMPTAAVHVVRELS